MRVMKWLLLLVAMTTVYQAVSIWQYGKKTEPMKTDAAIVLGAAVWGSEPSPVFRERIHHAIYLYETNAVEMIIFTGGKGAEDELAEAEVAKVYATKKGVPTAAIITEKTSRITEENLRYAKAVAAEFNLQTYTIISDPLHMKRTMLLAKQLDMEAYASPTQTTVYRSLKTKVPFLCREVFYYIGTVMTGVFR